MSPKLSASSTQEESHAFVQRSDDEEELWEVIEITKEKATMFKVRWKGDDPETGKPWAQSWVPKSDVTDDLKKDWKRRQKAKASRTKSKQSLNPRISALSSIITGQKQKGRSSRVLASGPRLSESKSALKSPRKTPISSRKRAFDMTDLTTTSQEETPVRSPEVSNPPEAGPSRPRKRQKVFVELPNKKEELMEATQGSYEVRQKKLGRKLPQESISGGFEDEVRSTPRVIKVKDRMKKKSPVKQKEQEREREKFLGDLFSDLDELDEAEYPQPTSTKTGKPRGVPKDSTSTNKPRILSDKDKQKATTNSPSEPFRRSLTASFQTDKTPIENVTPERGPAVANDLELDNEMELTYPGGNGYNQANISNQNIDHQDLPPDSDNTQHSDEHVNCRTLSPSSPEIGYPGDDDVFTNLDTHQPHTPKSGHGHLSEEVPATQSQELENVATATTVTKGGVAAEPGLEGGSLKSPSTPNLHRSEAKKPQENGVSTPKPDLPPQSSKSLFPVPKISPSVFYPHLPPGVTRGALEDDAIELDNSPSTIEYFTSSDKLKRREAEKSESIKNPSSQWSDTSLRAQRQNLVVQAQRGKGKARMPLDVALKWSSLESQTQTDQDLVDESRIQEMEDCYVDLNGGRGQDPTRPVPQEEEESTQDLELERLQHLRRLENDSSSIGVDTRAVHGWGHIGDGVNLSPSTNRALSATHPAQQTSKPIAIHQNDRMDEELPPTLSPSHRSSLDHHANVSNNLPTSTVQGLDNALSLLNVKSEEIAKLEAALSAERQQRAELESTNRKLQDVLASVQERSSRSEAALADAVSRLDGERVAWDAARTLLEAQVKSLTESKERAESDSNFFREQYGQASAFVGSTRTENAELEKRALIAEDQAKNGVAMIRATYEGKVKGLQDDVAKWKGLALLLEEKDRRTGDNIRKKAALEPELRARITDLVGELERLEVVVAELSRDRTVLKRRLENGREMDDIDAVSPDGTETHIPEGNLVYRCLWRPGNSSPCYGLFNNPEELELHMFNDQHIVVLEGDVLAD